MEGLDEIKEILNQNPEVSFEDLENTGHFPLDPEEDEND